MDDAELCADRAAQEIERGGELWAADRGAFEQLRRAIIAIAYATVSATDADGVLTMDPNHRESVMLAIKPLVAGMAAGDLASGSAAAAEARGYARCQADVVTWMRSPERIWSEQLDRAADAIDDGCHVGAAKDRP